MDPALISETRETPMTSDEEENAVRQLCHLLGYRRVLQLAQSLMRECASFENLRGAPQERPTSCEVADTKISKSLSIPDPGQPTR